MKFPEYADSSNATTAVSVECCWGVEEPAIISFSTFRNNETALGGYAGNDIIVRYSTFEDNTYAVILADKMIYNSTFTNNDYGLYATERVSVFSSTFRGNRTALWGGRGEVKYCDISNNVTGIEPYWEGFDLSENTISNNNVGVILGEFLGYSPPIEYNNIYDNVTYNLENPEIIEMYVPNNWWGTTDPDEISDKIYDGYDDPGRGIVYFEPILTELVKYSNPDIMANGSDIPITITTSDDLSVAVGLDAGNNDSENADWWVAAETPFGWYHYDVGENSWIPDLSFSYQGPLFDLTPFEVLNMTGLPTGAYIFYFGVDMNMNGSLDYSQLYYDSVIVNIE